MKALLALALVALVYAWYVRFGAPIDPPARLAQAAGPVRAPSVTRETLSATETLTTLRIPAQGALNDLPDMDRLCFIYDNTATGASHMDCVDAL